MYGVCVCVCANQFGEDPAELKNELDTEVNRDRLYFDKLAHAYGIFMQGGDDMPYLEQELAASFVAESEAIAAELEQFEKDTKRIEQDISDMEASQPPVSKLTDMLATMTTEKATLEHVLIQDEADLRSATQQLATVQDQVASSERAF